MSREEDFVLKIFCDLDTCRFYNMGAIPWKILIFYLERLGLDDITSSFIENVIRITDVAFLKMLDKEKES